MNENYKYFAHEKCEYFTCHTKADPHNFNCLFCYCPLYALGSSCGGDFIYLKNGIKDCSNCLKPHLKENYEEIINRFNDIVKLIQK